RVTRAAAILVPPTSTPIACSLTRGPQALETKQRADPAEPGDRIRHDGLDAAPRTDRPRNGRFHDVRDGLEPPATRGTGAPVLHKPATTRTRVPRDRKFDVDDELSDALLCERAERAGKTGDASAATGRGLRDPLDLLTLPVELELLLDRQRTGQDVVGRCRHRKRDPRAHAPSQLVV